MDIYVARQPIFDKTMQLKGYELLYRQGSNNFYEGEDDTLSTAALISNTMLVIGFDQLLDGTCGFINFSNLLLENDTALMLPKEKLVIEILERAEITPALLESCQRLHELGYTIALDDFALDTSDPLSKELIEIADIIKIEFPVMPLEEQRRLIHRYGSRITFLAEKVETVEDYRLAMSMGYDLFQGYFFSKPVMVKARDIQALDANLLNIIEELKKSHPNLKKVAEIVEMDLALSYKLLKMANTIAYEAKFPIKSIHHAVVHMGIREVSLWAHLILLKGFQHNENAEVIKMSMIRGKTMSLLCSAIERTSLESDCFITGMFSSIDLLLGQEMEVIVEEMPFTKPVKDALLGKDNLIYTMLCTVLTFENTLWDEWGIFLEVLAITRERYMELYLQALRWQQALPG